MNARDAIEAGLAEWFNPPPSDGCADAILSALTEAGWILLHRDECILAPPVDVGAPDPKEPS